VRRLVVLMPDVRVDEAALATRIWALAAPRGLAVLLLGAVRHTAEQAPARRRLALVAAITRDRAVGVETRLAEGSDWVRAARRACEPDDLLVCPSELTILDGFRRRPLAETLLETLQQPVYVLDSFYPAPPPAAAPRWAAQIVTWTPPVVVMAVFFVIQAQVLKAAGGWLQDTTLILSVIGEFLLIAAWERFLGNLL
jgi:hypothetical protein